MPHAHAISWNNMSLNSDFNSYFHAQYQNPQINEQPTSIEMTHGQLGDSHNRCWVLDRNYLKELIAIE